MRATARLTRVIGHLSRASVLLLMAAALPAETLDEAWALALARNHAYGAIQAETAAAEARAGAARAERWPRLTVEGGYSRFDDAPAFSFPVEGQGFLSPELVDDDDFYSARARLELPVFTGGRIGAGVEAATLSANAAVSRQESAGQDLKLAVAAAYVEVLRSRRAVTAASAQVASLESLVNDVGVMVEKEAVPRNDLLAARVTLADARQGLLRARNGEALATAAYNRLLGEPLDRLPVLEELEVPDTPAETLDDLIARAVAGRSDLAGLDARARSLAEEARSERAARWPQVGLMADYQHLENQVLDEEDFTLVGVGFEWNVFDAGRISQRAEALASAGRAAGREREELRSRIELEVRQAWLDREEARSRVAVTAEALEQSAENLRVAKELYGVGLATQTVVLDAEALRLTAVSNHDSAVLDAALAELRLKRATGTL